MAKEKKVYFPPNSEPRPLKEFDFKKENKSGFFWESRVPGTDHEQTWGSGDHEHRTLTDAVKSVLPDFKDYGLTIEKAAELLLGIGMILGTGMEIED